ncbi:MAG: penicillin acylase family protein [Spirochaetes bacterium]|nr:penicillin acylase family protein [Spirochaetota bacterium]
MTKKTLLLVASSSIIAAFLLAIGIYRYFFSSVSYHETITAGVTYPVAVYRLNNGYPLIIAENRDDAFFALGIVHAQDRLAQIEFLRSLATAKSVQHGLAQYERIDRLIKAVGLQFKAKALLKELSPQYVHVLQQYVQGINTFKSKFTKGNEDSAQWEAEDVVCITLFMEFCNAFVSNNEFFFPVEDKDFGLFSREITNKKIVRYYRKQDYQVVAQIRALQQLISSIFGLYGSYCRGFAVTIPSRMMYTDAAVLCASYEHSVSLYALLYPVNMQVAGKVIEGYTYAGLPYIIAGKTATVRYASFSLLADSQIFCKYQTLTRNNVQVYNSTSGYKELICQFDSSQCVTRLTECGPVISDAFEKNLKDAIIAIAHVSPEKGYIESMIDIAFINSANDVVPIAQKYKGQPRIFVVQDDSKAFQIIAGSTLLDTDTNVLKSPDKALFAKNPTGIFEIKQADYLVAGSEFVENPSLAAQQVMVFNNTDRLMAIQNELVRVAELHPKDIEKFLHGVNYPGAKDYLFVINNLLDKMPITSAKLAKVYFRDWNLAMSSSEVAPTLYNAIISSLIRETFADELPYVVEDILTHYVIFEPEFKRLFKDDKSIYFDDITTIEKTETRDIIFDRAFLHSLKYFNYTIGPYIDDWKWGTVHNATLQQVESSSLISNVIGKKMTLPFDGFDATAYRSLTKRTNFQVDTATMCSFYMDKTVHKVSLSASITNNELSRYYRDFKVKDYFKEIMLNNRNELFLINPVKDMHVK